MMFPVGAIAVLIESGQVVEVIGAEGDNRRVVYRENGRMLLQHTRVSELRPHESKKSNDT